MSFSPEFPGNLQESPLPAWEHEALSLQSQADSKDGALESAEAAHAIAIELGIGPKDAARAAYQARRRHMQDHATRGHKRQSDDKSWRSDVTKSQAIAMSFAENENFNEEPYYYGSVFDVDEPDTPAPIFYDGPYNPAKEAARKETAIKAADLSMKLKAENLLDELYAGLITKGEALQSLLDKTSGNNREALLDMMDDYINQELSFSDPELEFRALMGAGRLAMRSTTDVNPFDELHTTFGFSVTQFEY